MFVVAIAAAAAGCAWLERDADDDATFSLAATKRCLHERGRSTRTYPPGTWSAFPALEVAPYERDGITEHTVLSFAPTPAAARDAEVPDSERIGRRGNVLYPELLAPAMSPDPAVEACLDRAGVPD